ncbi:MAG: putative membrane protein [Candidatus Woesearchaeota archaeon]|jgi:uncharacterized membrane protein
MNKFIQLIVMMMVLSISVAFAVNTVPVDNDVIVDWIKVDGDRYDSGDRIKVDLGDTLDIRVKLEAQDDVEDVRVEVELVGYRYERNDPAQISDFSDTLKLKSGDTDYVDLEIDIPIRAEKDEYELRVRVDGRRVSYEDVSFSIRVSGPRDGILIRDVVMTPNDNLVAGRTLTAQARIENIGEDDLDEVKFTLSIPALNLENTVYLDELEAEDSLGRGEKKTTEEAYLRIPACTPAGVYEVVAEVEYEEYETTTQTQQVRIVDGGLCQQSDASDDTGADMSTKIIVPQSQEVKVGKGGTAYPIVMQNPSNVAKSFQISVSGVDSWGRQTVSDQAPIVGAGESKIVYVYVTANDGEAAGVRAFTVSITSQGKTQSIPVQAVLVESEHKTGFSFKKLLQVAVLVLVVLLIILALIVAFGKMRGSDSDDDDLEVKGQAYY